MDIELILISMCVPLFNMHTCGKFKLIYVIIKLIDWMDYFLRLRKSIIQAQIQQSSLSANLIYFCFELLLVGRGVRKTFPGFIIGTDQHFKMETWRFHLQVAFEISTFFSPFVFWEVHLDILYIFLEKFRFPKKRCGHSIE